MQLNRREQDILRRVEGGAVWSHLREVGFAEEGDLTRLVDAGYLTPTFSRGAELTDRGREVRDAADMEERTCGGSGW